MTFAICNINATVKINVIVNITSGTWINIVQFIILSIYDTGYGTVFLAKYLVVSI